MKQFAILNIIILSLLTTGCNSTKNKIGAAAVSDLQGSFTVTESEETTSKAETITFTLSPKKKTIKGTTGCNSFFGRFEIDVYAINFLDIAASERYCSEPIMDAERLFLNALQQTGSYAIKDGKLTLYSKTDRSVVLKAVKNPNTEEN